MQHGKVYEPIAREKYHSVVFYHLNRDVVVRETGCVVQPYLPWLVASPDGLVSDNSCKEMGLIEMPQE